MGRKEKKKQGRGAVPPPSQSTPHHPNLYGDKSSVLEWPINSNPPGGFVSYLQNPQYGPLNFPFHQNFGTTQQYAENFHFTGAISNHVPFSPPQQSPTHRTPPTPMAANRTPPPAPMADSNIGNDEKMQKKAQIQLEVEGSDDGELARTEKLLKWTDEEEIRLVSCWLNGSNDPIDGNNKKVEQYWEEVTAAYNSTTPKNRRRESGQLKLHWHRMKTKINNFNGCWKCVNAVYQSGMSDDQRMQNAMKKYRADYKETFKLVEMWKVLRDEPKWTAYVKRTENNSSTSMENDKNVVDLENLPRPIGCKAAKADRKGKRKNSEVPEAIIVIGDTIDKLVDAKASSKQDREKLTEVQQRLSAEKLQTAKIYKETKMLDIYKELLLADTSAMDDDAKAQRATVLDSLRDSLFGNKN